MLVCFQQHGKVVPRISHDHERISKFIKHQDDEWFLTVINSMHFWIGKKN
jgi:hypothetical protein